MSSRRSLSTGLLELAQVGVKFLTGEGAPFVGDVTLWYYTVVGTLSFEGLLGLQGLEGIETNLKFNMDISSGMIDKDTTSFVFVVGLLPSVGVEEPTTWMGLEVVD